MFIGQITKDLLKELFQEKIDNIDDPITSSRWVDSWSHETVTQECPIWKLQLLVIMLHPSSPKHNDKPDAEHGIDDS